MHEFKRVSELAREIRDINHGNGFDWPNDTKSIMSALMLIVTEVAEAAEEVRKPTREDHLVEELADIVIRVLDLAEALGLDIEHAIAIKMEINRGRQFMHGGKAL